MDTEPSACSARSSEAEYLAQMRELAQAGATHFARGMTRVAWLPKTCKKHKLNIKPADVVKWQTR